MFLTTCGAGLKRKDFSMKLMSKFYQRVIVLFLFASLTACGGLKPDLPKEKKTELGLYLKATEAYDLLKKDAKNIMFDVRTSAELKEGIPEHTDLNVPIFIKDKEQNKVVLNENFVSTIEDRLEEKGLDKESSIILICRQGYRSAKAVDVLAKLGYKKAYSVVDGVNGWKDNDLPLSYDVDAKESSDSNSIDNY
jgi:rhodanese-related sulfurtransferase